MDCSNVTTQNSFLYNYCHVKLFWLGFTTVPSHSAIIATSLIYNLFLLPPLLYILRRGYKQWRAQRLLPTASLMNLTDIQTFHSVVMQLLGTVGVFIYVCGSAVHDIDVVAGGYALWSVKSIGLDLTNLMVSVLYYMAVVHPVHYLTLKRRSVARTCTYLIAWIGETAYGIFLVWSIVNWTPQNTFLLSLMGMFCVIVAFCCISVLCALKRPRPGAAGGDQERDAQLKRRAFHTISAIMAAMLFKFLATAICTYLFYFMSYNDVVRCALFISTMLYEIPSTLVLPLLYLHRAGKLPCAHSKAES